MTTEVRLLLALLAAAPTLLFRHNSAIYDAARTELDEKGGALGRMGGLLNAIIYRVSKRIEEAVQQLAGQDEESILDVQGTIEQILEGSASNLVDHREVERLRDLRRRLTKRVRGLAAFLRWASLSGVLVAGFLSYRLIEKKAIAWEYLALFLLLWFCLQGALQLTQMRQDRVSDKFYIIESRYPEVAS